MFAKDQTLVITLQRQRQNTPWGLSVVGGVDQGGPITVTKVLAGSPSDKKLKEGDEITKIEDYDARDITHQNVYNLFQKAGTSIKLAVKRNPQGGNTGSINTSFHSTYQNAKPRCSLSSLLPSASTASIFSNKNKAEQVTYCDLYKFADTDDDSEAEHIQNQPYRTTPLVLPGAKAKHEAPTGSYLRHHPNPMMRSGSSHYEFLPQDVVMKQRVADSILQKIEQDEALAGKQIVRQQFNTPIGLYSNKNIIDTIHHSTGVNTGLTRSPSFGRGNQGMAPRSTVKYDPAKSETFKALQEEQYGDGPVHEVTTPAQPKVFTPSKQPVQRAHQPVQGHVYDPTSHSSGPNAHHHVPYVNSMGHAENQIAQSGSFKRLMHMVLSDY